MDWNVLSVKSIDNTKESCIKISFASNIFVCCSGITGVKYKEYSMKTILLL